MIAINIKHTDNINYFNLTHITLPISILTIVGRK